jgi:pimeloyl-ACP methyl ester carboxylesterase
MLLASCAVHRLAVAVLSLATLSACSPDSGIPAGTWIGFAQVDDWETFLELFITNTPNPSVRVVRMWPGQPGAEAHLKMLDSGFQFELESPVGTVRFEGRQERSALDGTLELAESQGRFSLRRMIAFAPLDFQPYEGAYELTDKRTVYVRRHDNVQQSAPYPVTGASYFLFDDSGRYRRLYPVAPDRFVAAERLSDTGSFFSELAFIRQAAGDVGAIRWQVEGKPDISGNRKTTYRQEDVGIESGNVRLTGRLLMPSELGPHPAVVVLHGLGAFTRNMAGPFKIADYLANRGVAVLSYDKRGVGGSTGGHPVNSRVSEYAADALLAVAYLAGRTEIDPSRIGLLGVSDGARVAAVAGGQSEQVAFLVLVSGRGLSFAETWPPDEVVDNLVAQLRARGFEEDEIQSAVRVAELDLAYSLNGEGWEELEDAIATYRDEPWFGVTQLGWVGADARDHRYWSRYNPPAEDDPQLALRRLRVPILAIWGELDPTFPPRVHKPGLEKLLVEAGHPDYTLLEFPNAGHGLEDTPPGKPSRGRGLADGYLETVGEWLKERFDP